MDDRIHTATVCPDCLNRIREKNVVFPMLTFYNRRCDNCGKVSPAAVRCRYTMSGAEKLRQLRDCENQADRF